jgi:hypothetical protein
MTLRYDCNILMSDWEPDMHQVIVPSDVLDAAEPVWAPPDDPGFQLVPPDFKIYVTQCFEPPVTFGAFWDVYRQLQDLVGTTVPGDVAMTLNVTIRDNDSGVPVLFALDDLQEQNLEGDEDEGDGDEGYGGEALCVDFMHEEGQDELF